MPSEFANTVLFEPFWYRVSDESISYLVIG